MEDTLFTSEIGVKTMPEFMGKGENVASSTGPVQQQEWMCTRHGVSTERPRPLARSHRRIDPVVIDEGVHYAGQLA